MNKELVKQGFAFVIAEVAYISLVASVMQNAERVFGDKPEVWSAVAFLLMFVLSATVSGSLILGKPILLYIDGKKREAFMLFGAILGWLAVFLIGLLLFLVW